MARPLRLLAGIAGAALALLTAGPPSASSAVAHTAKAAASGRAGRDAATIGSFAADLLHGDNGLPTAPDAPLRYGPISTPTDVTGEATDAHTESISYFDGEYYLYGVAWGCGVIWQTPQPGFCGFATYRSRDLMNWHLVDSYDPPAAHELCANQTHAICGKPRVVYSPRLHRYLMWFGVGAPTGNPSYEPLLWIAQSDSPAGPWGKIIKPRLAKAAASDFDITVGSDGTAYLIERLTGQSSDNGIWVEELNSDYTGTTGRAAQVMASGEGVGLFQHGSHWYATESRTHCGYCSGSATVYASAANPLGRWTVMQQPLASTSCGGEPHGVSVLPSPSGPVPIQVIDTYRTSPNTSGIPSSLAGDLNQAIAGRVWVPLRFDHSGHIMPFGCPSATRVPLARPAKTAAPPSYQVDCRVTPASQLEQTWTIRPGTRLVRVPVFQRTTAANIDTRTGPRTLNAPLTVELSAPSGVIAHATIDPDGVSWAPRSVTLRLPEPAARSEQVALRLSTQATNGCYGVLVGPRTPALPNGTYRAIENGHPTTAAGAQMLVRFGCAES